MARVHIPEETFPCWEVSAFEQRVFQYSLDTTQRLDHVSPVVVQVPQFAVVPLVCPPKRILLQNLETTHYHVHTEATYQIHSSQLEVHQSTWCFLEWYIRKAKDHIFWRCTIDMAILHSSRH